MCTCGALPTKTYSFRFQIGSKIGVATNIAIIKENADTEREIIQIGFTDISHLRILVQYKNRIVHWNNDC